MEGEREGRRKIKEKLGPLLLGTLMIAIALPNILSSVFL